MVIHAGGRIQTEDPESDEILEIDLHETAFADDDAVHFVEFPCLVRLFLANTKITDGLAHVQELTKLEWLDMAGTGVTGAGLAHLQGLTNLQWLSLAGTRVTDSGLVHLARLARLQALNLEGTQVTDAGLSHLAGLTRLERLNLKNTQVTDAGVARLQRALPKLSIQVCDRRWGGNRQPGAMCGWGFF
jgi:Leucine-rich repeat (LRR) protein